MTEQIDSCVKFSKNSWHYKMMYYIHGKSFFYHYEGVSRQTNLCPYFRIVALTMIIYPFIKLWRNMPNSIKNHEDLAKGIVGWLFFSLAIHLVLTWLLKASDAWWFGFTMFFLGLGAIGFVFLILYLSEKISYKIYLYRVEKRKRDRLAGKPQKEFKPSLFLEFIKSKHEKICPCIEFVDDEKK